VGLLLFIIASKPWEQVSARVDTPWITGSVGEFILQKAWHNLGTLLSSRRPDPKPGPVGHILCWKIDAAMAICKD